MKAHSLVCISVKNFGSTTWDMGKRTNNRQRAITLSGGQPQGGGKGSSCAGDAAVCGVGDVGTPRYLGRYGERGPNPPPMPFDAEPVCRIALGLVFLGAASIGLPHRLRAD